MSRHSQIRHGKRRLWYAPWIVVCWCGLEAHPCHVERMLRRHRGGAPAPLGPHRAIAAPPLQGWAGSAPPAGAGPAVPLLTLGQALRFRGRR